MPREESHEAIILKKQPFGEADEIVTFFTLEQGKVRALAKSSKLPTSKLQYALQPTFHVRVTLAGNGHLAKIIRTQILEPFALLHDHPDRLQYWYSAAELVVKSLGDEAKHEVAFDELLRFLNALRAESATNSGLVRSLIKFKLKFFESLGMGIHLPATQEGQLLFSPSHGGFYYGAASSDALTVQSETWQLLQNILNQSYDELLVQEGDVERVDQLVQDFIIYQLEREIKAESYRREVPGVI
jgi:DNA repair protein RecO